MTTEIYVCIIEDNKLIERHYLGMSGVAYYFPQGHFSTSAFLKLVTKFIDDIKEGKNYGYLDAWINSHLIDQPELEEQILTTIQAHPTANFQIWWEY